MAAFHGVLGEDDSDAESIANFVRRLREITGLPQVKIKQRGFGGCSGLIRKGAAQLSAWQMAGCTRAYVCYDADRADPAERRIELEKLIRQSEVTIPVCPILPIQEMEAWFHADVQSLIGLFDWCRNLKQHPNPESINDPKERLKEVSRHPKTHKYHYHPPTHNPVMAEEVQIEHVEARCPSFLYFSVFAREE